MESEGKRKVFSARMFWVLIVTFTLIVGSIYAYYTFNRQKFHQLLYLKKLQQIRLRVIRLV